MTSTGFENQTLSRETASRLKESREKLNHLHELEQQGLRLVQEENPRLQALKQLDSLVTREERRGLSQLRELYRENYWNEGVKMFRDWHPKYAQALAQLTKCRERYWAELQKGKAASLAFLAKSKRVKWPYWWRYRIG